MRTMTFFSASRFSVGAKLVGENWLDDRVIAATDRTGGRETGRPFAKRPPMGRLNDRIGAEALEEFARAPVVNRGPFPIRPILECIQLRSERLSHSSRRIGEVAAVEDVPLPREALQNEQFFGAR